MSHINKHQTLWKCSHISNCQQKKNSTKKVVYFLSSLFELAIRWRRKRKQSRQRRRECWATTTSIMWLSYVKKIASTMRTTISKAFWKIFTWIEHCDDDSQTQWVHKSQKIEHRDDVDHASWIRKRKKDDANAIKRSHFESCNAHSWYSFYKISWFFLSDLKNRIQQKNFFFSTSKTWKDF